MAIRGLREKLRVLHTEHGITWVDALPRVLCFIHDMPGESGFSPYQIVTGRERPDGGLLAGQSGEISVDAVDFIESRKEIDEKVAQILNEKHAEQCRKAHARLTERKSFTVGQRVKYLVPKESHLSVVKMQPRWAGPYNVKRRISEHTYEIEIAPQKFKEVHRDQLSGWVDDDLVGPPVPLYFYASVFETLEEDWWPVEKILRHRETRDGWSFLVKWEGFPESDNTWEPLKNFFNAYSRPLIRYIKEKKLKVDVPAVLEDEEIVEE